ncbi:hypothetical protein OXX80_005121 [Metschnikowia pulcherrima]
MDLGAFLADEQFGSWADEDVDMSSIGVPTTSSAAPVSTYRPDFNNQDFTRPDRVEYPVPDAPPYKARVANLPYDADEGALARFFEEKMQADGIVEDVKLPMDQMSGKPKGFAFVTFTERAVLEEALRLTMAEFNGRRIFVNVAAPQKADVFDMDWRSGRSGPLGRGEPRERHEEVELDWGAARNSSGPRPPRERTHRGDREFGERRFNAEEPDLDWGAARHASAPAPAPREPRERRPRRDEPDLDWGSARSGAPLPPKERESFRREREAPKREEKEFDWSSARGSGVVSGVGAGAGAGSGNFRRKEREEKDFDWKRGQALPPKPKTPAAKKETKKDVKKDVDGPQKSLYDVLSLEDDGSDAESAPQQSEQPEKPSSGASAETGLESQVAQVSVSDGDWKTVGK